MSNQQPDAPGQGTTPQGGFPQPGAYTPPQPSAAPANPAAPYPGQYTPPAQAAYPSGYPQQPAPGYPQQAYPSQPSPYQVPNYSAQYGAQGAPQAPYGAQQYPPQQAYPATWQTDARPAAKSPLLGIIAFVAIILTIVVGAVSLFQIMAPLMNAIVAAGPDAANDPTFRSSLQAQITTAYPLQSMLLTLCSPVGFAAWVVGWVAAIGKRGRLWGVLAIVLGVLAIPILLAVMFAAMGPALEALR